VGRSEPIEFAVLSLETGRLVSANGSPAPTDRAPRTSFTSEQWIADRGNSVACRLSLAWSAQKPCRSTPRRTAEETRTASPSRVSSCELTAPR